MATMSLGGAQIGHQGAPLDCKRSLFSVRVNLGERSELFLAASDSEPSRSGCSAER